MHNNRVATLLDRSAGGGQPRQPHGTGGAAAGRRDDRGSEEAVTGRDSRTLGQLPSPARRLRTDRRQLLRRHQRLDRLHPSAQTDLADRCRHKYVGAWCKCRSKLYAIYLPAFPNTGHLVEMVYEKYHTVFWLPLKNRNRSLLEKQKTDTEIF